jgi:diguanylate cyclase (GGDEF)-like protein
MRGLALIGLVASLVLGAVALAVTNEEAARRRAAQDRALQAATSAELALIESGERQAESNTAVLLGDPAVRGLLMGSVREPQSHAAAVRGASEMLHAMAATAFVPVSSACLTGGEGAQLACWPQRATGDFAGSSLGAGFIALVRGAKGYAVSNPFVSPLTGRLTVALVVPLRLQGAGLGLAGSRHGFPEGTATGFPRPASGSLAGVVHMDVDGSLTQGKSVVVHSTPGARVELAAYEGGTLELNNRATRLTQGGLQAGATLPVQGVKLGRRPVRLLNGGHRVMALALPLTFGPSHQGVAVVATAVGADPTLANTISAQMLAVGGVGVILLALSLGAIARDHREMTRELATDELTGLRNRRALVADLERACRSATVSYPARLWLFDLDDFKRYNDAFGRAAGDTMLERLGGRLRDAMAPYGRTYRAGGDEMCVLVRKRLDDPEAALARAREALSEKGGAFDIAVSVGAVSIPRDTAEAAQALLLADQRMYHEKAAKGADATELVTAVLGEALAQRHPDLGNHVDDVAGEAEELALAVGLDQEGVALVKAAASLHDIGKLGVPDKIITKPGPLTAEEWEFIKQHTVIGEQIIAAAGLPMEGIGPLVRSSHERFDGTGYPDGLAGEEIPLGARIITICDAFGAMVAERAYKPAMSIEDALAELRRCAGTQFDPGLVDIFCAIIARRTGIRERPRQAAGQAR